MLSAAPTVVEAATRRETNADDKLPPLGEDSSSIFTVENFTTRTDKKPNLSRGKDEDDWERIGIRKRAADASTTSSSSSAAKSCSSAVPSSRFGWLGSNKKTVKMATSEELVTVQRSLMTCLAQGKTDMGAQLTQVTKELRQDINNDLCNLRVERANDILAAKDEMSQNMSTGAEKIKEDMSKMEAKLESRIQEAVSSLESSVTKVRDMELNRWKQSFAESIDELRTKVNADMSSRFDDMLLLVQQQQRDHAAALATFQQTFEEHQASNRQELTDTKAAVESSRACAEEELQKLRDGLESALDSRVKPLQSVLDILSSGEGQGVPSRTEVETQLALIQQSSDAKLACLNEQTRSLRVAIAEVENIPTRRVDWQLSQASEVLQAADGSTEDFSFFSPEFEAGGAHGLQLELRIPAKSGKSSAEGEGDCELLLWGAECSLSLVFRLYIGSAHVELQHKFDVLQPCSSGSLCFWKDHINQEDDTLQLGVEILEAIREVSLPSRLVSCSDTDNELASFPWRKAEGALASHRHLIHRTLDLVQDQVDLMKSRMVHRVEWRIERASELRRAFPAGECLCSSSFDAGGVEGLQLVFFPSGHSDAREGHCSLYVYCPPGALVHCWLTLGRQRWEALKAFDIANGYYGRTSFCRFDACVDEKDNTILVVMELQEARQDVSVAPHSHHAVQKLANGAANIDSVITLRRTAAQNTLEDVKVLPSLWISKPNVARELEDFRTFEDLPAARKPVPPTARRIASGGRCRPTTANGRCRPAAESPLSCAATERYQMYAAC